MKCFKFIDTDRFSPVIYGNDLPWKEDYFHLQPDSITKEYLTIGEYIIDENWWNKQKERCKNGYTIKNAFVEGGDFWSIETLEFRDDKTGEMYYWGKNIEQIGINEYYLPELGIKIKNGDVTITGRHYFYLNFWKILAKLDNGKRKVLRNPKFTDLSFENWWIRERARNESKDLLFAKARQKGLSQEEACDTAFEFLFYKSSQSVIVSGEEKYCDITMGMVQTGLSKLRNTQFFKEYAQGGNNEEYKKSKTTASEIYIRTCKNNEQSVSGLSPSKVHLEEIGIWTKGLLNKVTKTLDESLEAEGEITGFRIYTGTGGDIEEGVADMETMTYNPKAYNLLSFENISEGDSNVKIARFVSAAKFKLIDEFGNSLMRKSTEYILNKIDIAEVDEKYVVSVMNPLKLSMIFRSKSGCYFGTEIAQWCNERKSYIKNHREAQIVTRYTLRWKDPKRKYLGVDGEPNESGVFLIGERPKMDSKGEVYENLYRAATDSYDQDESHYSTSKGAIWIKKGFYNANETANKYVAGLIERPDTSIGGAELFYEHTAMLCMFYRAMNLIEFTKFRIMDWYVKEGLTFLLKERPSFVTANMIQNTNAKNKYGIDASTKPFWLSYQKSYLSDRFNIEQTDFIELLEAWSSFRYDPSKKYNCDNTIASSLCTVFFEDEKEMEVVDKSQKKSDIGFFGFIKKNEGFMQKVG